MKRYIIWTFVVMSAFLSSCSGGGEDNGGGGGKVDGPEIVVDDIVGQWRLFSWNGAEVDTKLFDVYVKFDAAGTMMLYQHVADFGYKQLSGSFVIKGAALSGSYEGGIAWSNSYTVAVSDDKSTMKMQAIENSDICIYKKAVLPASIEIRTLAEPLTRESGGFTPFL